MKSNKLEIFSPFTGAFINLCDVPDPVFAEKMVGDGFAIDPFESILHSPVDGKIKSIHRAKHAITIETAIGLDMLIHVGLETVALGGEGFKPYVKEGDTVKVGDKLSEFDINKVAPNVPALITPVLLTELEDKDVVFTFEKHGDIVNASDKILVATFTRQNTNKKNEKSIGPVTTTVSDLITVTNHHGIHARPAAILNAIARKFPDCEILLNKGEQAGNVKSVVSLLSLSVQFQDQVKFTVKGENGTQIIEELTTALNDFEDDASEDLQSSNNDTENKAKVENNKYFGLVASNGLALAKITKQQELTFKYDRFTSDINSEIKLFDESLKVEIKRLQDEIAYLTDDDQAHKNILVAHLMILTDPELATSAKNKIAKGNSAAFGWDSAINDACKALDATKNQLLMERKADFLDVKKRLLLKMCGEENMVTQEFTDNVILIADDFTPSDIIGLDTKVVGLVSVKGGATSHVSILARTKGIPLLVGVDSSILELDSEMAILDTLNNSFLKYAPSEDESKIMSKEIKERENQLRLAKEQALQPSMTTDGFSINCLGNIGNIEEAKIGKANGGDGVGLFRTEFMYLDSPTSPTEEEQYQVYSSINKVIGDKPFVIRTLDAGGDKNIPYIKQEKELNPMLGVRGVRLCLANKELFKTQIRAILRTNADNIKVMVPMISKLKEYREVKQLFEEIKSELKIKKNIKLGIMVEVPSVALTSEAFAKEVDFMSIGTNDLTQYVLAIDREHTQLAQEVDHLHPAVLNAINMTVKGANVHNTELSVCGLMASEKIAIPVLIGLGVKNLSMTVSAIAENKAFIRSLNMGECVKMAQHCLSLTTALEVRQFLNNNIK